MSGDAGFPWESLSGWCGVSPFMVLFTFKEVWSFGAQACLFCGCFHSCVIGPCWSGRSVCMVLMEFFLVGLAASLLWDPSVGGCQCWGTVVESIPFPFSSILFGSTAVDLRW